MPAMIPSNMISLAATNNVVRASNGGDSSQSKQGASFANILSGSVKATTSPSGASQATQDSPETPVKQTGANANSASTPATFAVCDAAAQDASVTVLDDAPVIAGKTEPSKDTTTSVDNSYNLLMLMLQAITTPAITTAQSSQNQSAQLASQTNPNTTAQNLPVIGKAGDTAGQETLLQLLAQVQMLPQTNQTKAITAAIHALTEQGNTSAQLSQSITQINELLQGQSTVSSAQATIGDGAPTALASIPALTTTGTSLSQLETADIPAVKTDSISKDFSVAYATLSTDAGSQTAISKSSLTPLVTGNQVQTRSVANQSPVVNPVLASLQAQFAGKLTLESQQGVRSSQTELKISSAADAQTPPANSTMEAVTDKTTILSTATQDEQNSLSFNSNQLLQPTSDAHMNHFTDSANGSFSQVLSSEQAQPASINTATITSQPTLSKDPFQVMQQIVDQAKLITRVQNTEMVIRLQPEHLGELTLKITVEQGLVNATFHSNNSDVRSAIESSLPQLKQDLVNSGLKIDHVGVYTGLNQFMSNQQNNSSQQPQLKFTRKEAADNFDDVAQLAAETQLTSSDGVDYRI